MNAAITYVMFIWGHKTVSCAQEALMKRMSRRELFILLLLKSDYWRKDYCVNEGTYISYLNKASSERYKFNSLDTHYSWRCFFLIYFDRKRLIQQNILLLINVWWRIMCWFKALKQKKWFQFSRYKPSF